MTHNWARKRFHIAIAPVVIAGVLAAVHVLHAQMAPPAWKIHQRSFALAANQTAEETLKSELPAEVLNNHVSFAEKALLIRGTDVVDSTDFQSDPAYSNSGPWSFASVIDRAFRRSGTAPEAVQGKIQEWAATPSPELRLLVKFWKAVDPKLKSVNKIPLRLLAVVNRIDLATMSCGPGKIGGAEVRFVYAGIPQPPEKPFFTGIVEFVLPCMSKADFQTMGAEWISLASEPSSTYLQQLERILDRRTSQASSVRVRVNGKQEATWNLGQFGVNAQGIVRQGADRQPDQTKVLYNCADRNTDFNEFVKSSLNSILNSNYVFTGQTFGTNIGTIIGATPSVLTLANLIVNSVKTDEARFSLSLNSCTGCHGWETVRKADDNDVAPFDHVKYRPYRQQSLLSNFLTGTETGNPGVGLWTVQPPVLSQCNPPQASARHYNDLLRRHLYLYILGSLDPNAADQVWADALKPSELTTSEVD
jgi:hypothetical protein